MTETGKIRAFPLPQKEEDKPAKKAKAKPIKKEAAPTEEETMQLAAKFAALNKEDFKELSSTPRRRAREAALLLSFQMDMGGESWELAKNVLVDLGLEEAGALFAMQLAQTASEQQESVDIIINKYTREWTVDRLAAIDRNILRLAVAELWVDNENAAIIINEAIELAKKFGDENSSAFVNGILDAVRSKELGLAATEKQQVKANQGELK